MTESTAGFFAEKGHKMRRIIGCLMVLLFAGAVHAQDVKPDDLKKLLDQTRAELQRAQDRKAELSARVNELEKATQAQAAQLDDLKRAAAAVADRTLFLSTQYAAWTQFLALNPALKSQWTLFEDSIAAAGTMQPPAPFFMDPNWPLSQKK
jgi:septal ring factor EnvC (AmiA/AmiB activator)